MRYLNISQIYSQYGRIFDFTLFLILFLGLAQVAFGKRFEGRGGKAVVVALGVSLAVGLSVAEASFGFNLGSLSGLAVAILIIAFGLLFFFLMNSLGLQKTTSLSWSFILAYLFLESLSTKLSLWFQEKFPVINLIFLIACLFAIIKGVAFLDSGSTIKGSAKDLLAKGYDYVKNVPIGEEKQERKGIKEEDRTINKEIKLSSRMVGHLQEIKRLIQEYGNSEKGRKVVAKHIEILSTQESKLLQKLQYLRDLDRKLEELDIIAVRRLKEEYGQVPEEQKAQVVKEIQDEKDKCQLSQKMEIFENQIKVNVNSFNICIRSCVEYLGKSLVSEALQSIDGAIQYQITIEKLFEEMDRIGAFLVGLTKRDYKAMKKEMKKVA